jgi:hypothetical protein
LKEDADDNAVHNQLAYRKEHRGDSQPDKLREHEGRDEKNEEDHDIDYHRDERAHGIAIRHSALPHNDIEHVSKSAWKALLLHHVEDDHDCDSA